MYWSSCLSRSSLLTLVAPPRPRPLPRPEDWPRGDFCRLSFPPRRFCWPLPRRCPLPRPRPRWIWFPPCVATKAVDCARPPRLAPLRPPRVRGDFWAERFGVLTTAADFLDGVMILPRVRVPLLICPPPRTIVWLTMSLVPRWPRAILDGVTVCTWVRIPRWFPLWLPRTAPRLIVSFLWVCVAVPRNRVFVFTVAPRRCLMLFYEEEKILWKFFLIKQKKFPYLF